MNNYTQGKTIKELAQDYIKAGFKHIIPCKGKRPVNRDWQNKEHLYTATEFNDNNNIGIRLGSEYNGRYLHVIDADVYNESLTVDLIEWLEDHLGSPLPIHTGELPKFKCFILLDKPHTKIKSRQVSLNGTGKKSAVELLGNGQQAVVEGIHPDTNEPYSWDNDPIYLHPDYIPHADIDKVLEFIAYFEKQVNLPPIITSMPQQDSPVTPYPNSLNSKEGQYAHQILEILDAAMMDYDNWRNVGMALKQEFGDAGWTLFDAWSSMDPARYNPEANRGQWDAFERKAKGEGISFGTLIHMGREAGWDISLNAGEFLRQNIVTLSNGYWDLSKNSYYKSAAALNAMYGYLDLFIPSNDPEQPPTRVMPARWLMLQENKLTANSPAWQPVSRDKYTPIIQWDHCDYVNTYRPLEYPKPQAGLSIEPWLEIVRFICGEYADLVLDHMAFSIQRPETKIRWQVLCFSPQTRNGKTLTFEIPVLTMKGAGGKVSGQLNKSGWGDIYLQKKMIMIEEIFEYGHELFNTMKDKFANDGLEKLNIKGQGMMIQPNLYSIYMLSNHKDAIAMQEHEDKLLVIKAPETRLPAEKYETVGAMTRDWATWGPVFFDFFMKRDVSNFQYTLLPVRTDALREMCQATQYEYEQQMNEWLDDEEYPYYGGQFVSLPVLKKELKNNNFTAGQKGIVRALERQGFVPTRIQKRVDGSVKKLRLYVHESLQDTPHTELYDILKNMNYPI